MVAAAQRVALVIDPVVHLELDPGGRQDVEERAGMNVSRVSSSRLTTIGSG